MLNALTIDVEDYFQVTAFEGHVRREEWPSFPLRVVENTTRILAMLDEYDVKGTFFILGWVAERVPQLAKEICRRGHEIACHGYGHQLIYHLGPKKFRADVRRAKRLLEDLTGVGIAGYRAPSYSITGRSMWALEVLVEEGFRYDSSIFPIMHDVYGVPDAGRFRHDLQTPAGPIHEFPLSTVPLRLPGKTLNLPVAGGGYLRFLPAPWIKRALLRINRVEKEPVVVYFHPWEIDPGQPKIKASARSRFRHYLNLHRMERKIRYLLQSLRFVPMGELLPVPAGKEGPWR
jgi:polysaccharide deacetylase family protein (PEP-CTERM system associated)